MEQVRVGFIGLGIMGRPMALNVLRAGFPLTVWNRSRPGVDALVAAGAEAAPSAADVAARSQVVITMVTDAPDVEEVALGPEGIVRGARPGLTVIDMTTTSPAAARRLAAALASHGVAFLDAPVTGGDVGAREATLTIMVGGDAALLERHRPVLAAVGRRIVHCGPAGAGQAAKLCNQIMVALTNLGVSEALALAAKAGVAPETLLEAVSGGAARSWTVEHLAPRILRDDFRPGFKVDHQAKDLRHALETARELALPLPGTALAHELFTALQARGLGQEGTQALVKALEWLGDVRVPRSAAPAEGEGTP